MWKGPLWLALSNVQRESEAPSVAIRDMVSKLQAYVVPKGVREEVRTEVPMGSRVPLVKTCLIQAGEPPCRNTVTLQKLDVGMLI